MEINFSTVVSVIIPCLRGGRSEAEFIELIESCLSQTYPLLEIIFVSNQHDESLEARLKNKFSNDSRFHFLETRRLGANRARHLGALAASGEILYFLDDDCRFLSKDHLKLALAKLTYLPSGAILGGSYLGDEGVFGAAYHEMVTSWILVGANSGGVGAPAFVEVDNLLGGNFLLNRKSYFHRPFRHNSPYGGEDTDFFRSQAEAGSRLFYCPELSVKHLENNSLKKILFRAWCHGKVREDQDLKSNLNKRGRLRVFMALFKKNKAIIWFFLIHFFVLYLAVYVEKLKKLTKPVKNMGAENEIEYGTH
jgi:glycosyltransferase involved in cell wall biosynthesis